MNLIFCMLVTLLFLQATALNYDGKHNIQKRVVLGKNASPTPYIVSLQTAADTVTGILEGVFDAFKDSSNWTHICGGSIISVNYVLTAAHCSVGFNPPDLSVYCGSQSRKEGGIRHFISHIKVHEEYVELQHNDIALLKVAVPFTFTDKVNMIHFDKRFVEEDEQCLLSGWGYDLFVPVAPRSLKQAWCTVISTEECKESFDQVDDREICTDDFLSGACNGDSGGPLACGGNLTGAVSYGFLACGVEPVAFTRVSEYFGWILLNMI